MPGLSPRVTVPDTDVNPDFSGPSFKYFIDYVYMVLICFVALGKLLKAFQDKVPILSQENTFKHLIKS